MKQQKIGFTMIELLIVIAVLGILAVAVLSALDPIEQMNRGKDTGSRSDAEQIIGAIDRYYTIRSFYPWQANKDDLTDEISWIDLASAADETGAFVLDKLDQAGLNEIRDRFSDHLRDPNYRLFIYHQEGTETVYACFSPKSRLFQVDASNRCATGVSGLIGWPSSACGNAIDCGLAGNCSCLP